MNKYECIVNCVWAATFIAIGCYAIHEGYASEFFSMIKPLEDSPLQ